MLQNFLRFDALTSYDHRLFLLLQAGGAFSEKGCFQDVHFFKKFNQSFDCADPDGALSWQLFSQAASAAGNSM